LATSISIKEFLKLSEHHPIIDVRTPAEFQQGHIPGAINLPLFTNEERKIVGTIYKQEGKQAAILKGLELVGPKLHEFIREISKLTNSQTLLFHCWRGGMRSGSMAWLFETYGYKAITLKGGYKYYRRHVLDSFKEPKNIVVVGGRTGSGKTLILHQLQQQGQQIVDIEKLAHHKGSSFGSFGEQHQTSNEQFENNLCENFSKIDHSKICWVEDESRKIGVNILPDDFWNQLRSATVFYVDLNYQERVKYLVEEYGKFSKEELIIATQRIGKKLGGQHVKRAIEAIMSDDLHTACEISLVYYDRSYDYGLSQRESATIKKLEFDTLDPAMIASQLIEKSNEDGRN
jgi:tRNA 2-selenouridine synthase